MTPTPAARRFRDRPRIRVGLSIVPSLFTIGNMFCGFYSVTAAFRGQYDYAAVAIGVGLVLDILDGRIARMTNTTSRFGLELDSLADVLTFGVAPAVLALNWGIGSAAAVGTQIAQDLYKFGWLAAFGFVIAGALRLARFNVLAQHPSDGAQSKRDFIGLPIPAAAAVIAAVVHFRKAPLDHAGLAIAWCLLVAVLAFLMISTVRYPSFKELDLKKPLPRAAIAATAMLIGLVVFYSEIVLLAMAALYVASGPFGRFAPALRRGLLRGSHGPAPNPGSRGDSL